MKELFSYLFVKVKETYLSEFSASLLSLTNLNIKRLPI